MIKTISSFLFQFKAVSYYVLGCLSSRDENWEDKVQGNPQLFWCYLAGGSVCLLAICLISLIWAQSGLHYFGWLGALVGFTVGIWLMVPLQDSNDFLLHHKNSNFLNSIPVISCILVTSLLSTIALMITKINTMQNQSITPALDSAPNLVSDLRNFLTWAASGQSPEIFIYTLLTFFLVSALLMAFSIIPHELAMLHKRFQADAGAKP